jgi:catechol 2,3-dioxygenase-like lactoylglutathione lyase family enzyme
MRFRHIGITVFDLKKMLFFYQDILGYKIHKKALEQGKFIDSISNLKNVEVTTVKMIPSNNDMSSMIELLKYHSHETNTSKLDISNGGITHFALTVENIKDVYGKLLKNGIEFHCPPKISDDGGAIVTFCRDPENNLIELVQEVK